MNEQLREYLPILIPGVVILFAIALIALVDLKKQAFTRGPKWFWVLVICFIQFVGPLAYFTLGKKEE